MSGASFSSVSMRILSPDGRTILAELQTIDRVANNTAGRVGRTTSRAIGDVEKSAVKGSLGLARVNNSMIQLMRTTTGASPILGQLTDVIGTFAFGIGPMVGVLAGVTALAIGFQKITQSARESKEAARALTIELGKLAKLDNIGAIGGRFGTSTQLFSGNEFAVQGFDENGKKMEGGESAAAFLVRQRGILGARAEIERLKSEIARITGGATAGARLRAAAVERDQLAKLEAELGKVEKRYEGIVGLMREMETHEGSAASRRLEAMRDGKGAESSRLDKLLRDATGATDIGNLRFADGLKSGGFFNPAEQWQQVAEMMREGLKKTPPLAPGVMTDDLLRIMGWDQTVTHLADQMGMTLSDAIANGVTTALKAGSLTDGFKALTGAILVGLGDMMIAIGTKALLASALIEAIKIALGKFDGAAGIGLSLALIGAGAAVKALGGKMSGGGGYGGSIGGGYGGSYSTTGQTIIDRGLINPLNGVVTSPGTIRPRSSVNINNPVFIGTNDPVAQRQLLEMIDKANARRGS